MSPALRTTRTTYWYTAAVKRWIANEQVKTTLSGKILLNERWELEAYRVK